MLEKGLEAPEANSKISAEQPKQEKGYGSKDAPRPCLDRPEYRNEKRQGCCYKP
jgi:hypothetical protein